ncbi:hypothetical protein SAY87_009298 [Trapa incisa]|uniref:Peptidase A1 domain-containing protein n=1 Tax=Trapa incisa TaxID=236973 RepID=A0AAN7JWC9_9MYRT|nr:hypothetical protein SAY87_009298 [Trapa incisa]
MGTPFGSITVPILVLVLFLTVCCCTSGSSRRRIVTSLIHRDSVISPYYNPQDSSSDRAERLLEVSVARLAYFQAMSSVDSADRNIRFDLVRLFPMLLVNFSLGDPPVPQLTIMDTGSNLLWVQCLPCRNCSRAKNVFNPTKSSTYSRLSCNTSYCRYVPDGKCGSSDECLYYQAYLDGPYSKGELAREQLVFETSDDGRVTVSDVVFGCGHENGKFQDEKFTGVLGLGSRLISVQARLGSAFSYCIGSLFNPNYRYNKLILGEGAIMEGDSTPMRVDIDGLYHITLESISFRGKFLEIDNRFFGRSRRSGNSVVDSGTTITWLEQGAYRALFKEVKNLLDGVLKMVDRKPLRLCYQGSLSRDLVGFPAVTFHFADGAELSLDSESLFYQAGDVFCMAVAPSEIMGLSIFGLMAQQYYNIAFDVASGRAYFQRIECQLLED